MDDANAVAAACDTHTPSEMAAKEFQRAGFDIKELSIVAKDYQTGEQVARDKVGAFWESLWDLSVGAANFCIPGLGAALVAGPLVAWIVSTLSGTWWWEV